MPHSSSPNRLIHETSPYLLQHAHNPVEWHPWGVEALARAREENKPILLSIGYSACHWCHVMAHESFEDEETARLMNALYVNVKVDREERPDLDKIYQLAHQLLTQRGGGWPLTMFLSPQNLVPFFGGTYFPKTPRHGLPGFGELLRAVSAYHHDHRDDIEQQNQRLTEALAQFEFTRENKPAELNPSPLDNARQQLAQSYDAEHGGFGGAPKFPHPPHIERLLRHWAMSKSAGQADDAAFAMAETTLVKMADGGIYDQLGGGFCRYSVDERWMIPHFEKMLYDNGPLLSLYGVAWQITGNPLFHRIATETAEWVMREMQSPQGGYYSTLDADSEGEEGRFYVWRKEEIESLLSVEEYRVFARRFGLDQPPNFEGAWHLHVYQGLKSLTQEFSLPRERVLELVDEARRKLFLAREPRIHPGRDEKILTAWNGLMIKGMAEAGGLLQREDFIDSAVRAVDFIRTHLWRDGRLLVCYKDGRARFAAYLDDYVFLLDGILSLLQTRWRDGDLAFAKDLAEAVLTHFEDKKQGGFFFTAHDHETLLYRPKTLADEALPSGNGVAATVLGRLGHLLGETRYLDAAERTLKAAWGAIRDVPYAHDSLLTALEEYLYPPQFIVLRGDADAMQSWQQRCRKFYAPRRYTFAIPATAGDLPGRLASCVPAAEVTAYVCNESSCSAPVTQLSEFETLLSS